MEILLGILAVVNPVLVAWGTILWQNRKEKRDAKIRLFTTLMAYRKSYPISREWASALNLIDVVFADYQEVANRWHELYDLLQPSRGATAEQKVHKHLELLSDMAVVLGYKHLKQTDIDKFYIPQSHGDEVDLNAACQREWYRVLQNTNQLLVNPIHNPQPILDATIPAIVPALPPLSISQVPQTLPIEEKQN